MLYDLHVLDEILKRFFGNAKRFPKKSWRFKLGFTNAKSIKGEAFGASFGVYLMQCVENQGNTKLVFLGSSNSLLRNKARGEPFLGVFQVL